jgi:CDP-diacylglycerol--serine O-phosphatidyltransferase
MNWIRILPTCLTLLGLVLGGLSLFHAADGSLELAAAFIIAAALVDSLDGEFARLLRCESAFGERLDSYVDTVSFGAAPALLAYQATMAEIRGFSLVLGCAILLAGVYRFSRLPLPHPTRLSRHTFRGLPIPVCAVWIALFVLFSVDGFLVTGGLSLTHGMPAILTWLCTFLFLLLEISDVRYTKPSKPTLAMGIMALLVVSLLTREPGQTAGVLTCSAILLYVFVSPLVAQEEADELSEDMEGDDEPLSVNR